VVGDSVSDCIVLVLNEGFEDVFFDVHSLVSLVVFRAFLDGSSYGPDKSGDRYNLPTFVPLGLRVAGGRGNDIVPLGSGGHHAADNVNHPILGCGETRNLPELNLAHPVFVKGGVG
jgi:hypothetical protein